MTTEWHSVLHKNGNVYVHVCEQERLDSSDKATEADVRDPFKGEDCQGITVIIQKNKTQPTPHAC